MIKKSILLPEIFNKSDVNDNNRFTERILINQHYNDKLKSAMKADMHWLFAPGTSSYLPQLSNYCNHVQYTKNGITKKITNTKSYGLIGNKYNYVKFAEIVDEDQVSGWNWIIYYILIVFHFFKSKIIGIKPHDFYYSLSPSKFNLGQTNDISCIDEEYNKIKSETIIAYGTSRGSLALINWMVKCKPKNVKAIVLEGTPSSLADLVNYSSGFYYIRHKLSTYILPLFTNYRSDYNCDLLQLPKDIPILFITSTNDEIVPSQCTLNMYSKMKKHGYNNVYCCVLGEAHHSDYLSNNSVDRETYINAVIACYEKIN